MKINVVVLACLCLLLLLNGAHHVEARRHRAQGRNYKLFVFGDSFADVGNRHETAQRSKISREWYTPYGMSDSAHGYLPTGRFSDGLVQSDFLAQILGRDESPPPFKRWVSDKDHGRQFTGVNFAVDGASVLNGSEVAPSLHNQIDQLGILVNNGDIDSDDLEDSVALIAISFMQDYGVLHESDSDDEFRVFANRLSNKIVQGVSLLQRLGVSKVLVDAGPPLGCTPFRSWNNNYDSCDTRGNQLSGMLNAVLEQKLADKFDDVLLLDLEEAFNRISKSGVYRMLMPCCDSPDPKGYCGEVDARGTKQYSVCPNPANFFYWDLSNPTQAAWNAVMEELKDPIKDFLGI